MQTGVRIIRKENALHIAAGSCFGRNRELSEFHAGEALVTHGRCRIVFLGSTSI